MSAVHAVTFAVHVEPKRRVRGISRDPYRRTPNKNRVLFSEALLLTEMDVEAKLVVVLVSPFHG
jgi:hypothetical protein